MSSVRVAVVGAGPAGLYTVEHLLRSQDHDLQVDVLTQAGCPKVYTD